MKACLYFWTHENVHPSSAQAWITGILVMFRHSFCFVLNPCSRQQNKIRPSLLNSLHEKTEFCQHYGWGTCKLHCYHYLGRRKCSPLWLIHISMICLASGWKRDYRCHNTFPSLAFLAYMYHEHSSPTPANVICFNAGNSKSIK